jgi:hypothetical protein
MIACEAKGWDFDIRKRPRGETNSAAYSMVRKWESFIVEAYK